MCTEMPSVNGQSDNGFSHAIRIVTSLMHIVGTVRFEFPENASPAPHSKSVRQHARYTIRSSK